MSEAVYIAAMLLSAANGLAILLVNPRRPINRVYFAGALITSCWLFCVAMAIQIGDKTSPDSVNPRLIFWLKASAATSAFIVLHICAMRATLVHASKTFWRPLRSLTPWLLVPVLLATVSFTEYYIPSTSTRANPDRGIGYFFVHIVIIASGFWVLWDSIKHMNRLTGVRRLELQFFVFCSVAAGLLMVINNIVSVLVPRLSGIRRFGPIWILLWQTFIFFALCHHRVFDAKQVLLRVGQRLFLFGILAGAALLTVKSLEGDLDSDVTIFGGSMVACALAVLCEPPLRRKFGLDSQQLVAAQRSQMIEWTREGLDEESLKSRMRDLLKRWCQTDHVQLISSGESTQDHGRFPCEPLFPVGNTDGWVTPESLDRQKPSEDTPRLRAHLTRKDLGALLSVPRGSRNPNLFIALGRKHSERPYTYPDIQILLELAELMDNILTHARAAARMAQIEKMESAAMMSRGLAHDLNNLATPVSTFLLHMENRVAAGTAEAEVLADAKHSIQVMQDYIRESLFFARQLVPDFRQISAAELLASSAKVCQARAQARGVNIQIENPADIHFTADRVLMQRLLQNLLFNAIDASPRGGKVSILVDRLDEGRISIGVTDQGPGVPLELRDRIFEPYFTTKDTGDKVRGLGLGLAICLKIGHLHGATLSVDRSSSGGAIFTVVLPDSPKPFVSPAA